MIVKEKKVKENKDKNNNTELNLKDVMKMKYCCL